MPQSESTCSFKLSLSNRKRGTPNIAAHASLSGSANAMREKPSCRSARAAVSLPERARPENPISMSLSVKLMAHALDRGAVRVCADTDKPVVVVRRDAWHLALRIERQRAHALAVG